MREWTLRLTGVIACTLLLTVALIAQLPRGAAAQVVASATPTGSFPTPPETPECIARNFIQNDIVRAGIPDQFMSSIFCRTLIQNSRYIFWRTNQITDAENIGIEALLERNIVQAVDVFSPGLSYYENGIVMCLRGSGEMIYLNANQAPRHPEIVGTYTVPEFRGYTCLTLFEPGTLILLQRIPPTPRPTVTPRG